MAIAKSAAATYSTRMSTQLQITVNGQPHALQAGAHVSDLIASFKLDTRRVAVERNLAIVPRSAYADTALMTGDRVEIVGFIGGG